MDFSTHIEYPENMFNADIVYTNNKILKLSTYRNKYNNIFPQLFTYLKTNDYHHFYTLIIALTFYLNTNFQFELNFEK